MDKLIPDPPFNTTTPNAEATQAEALLSDREAVKRTLDTASIHPTKTFLNPVVPPPCS